MIFDEARFDAAIFHTRRIRLYRVVIYRAMYDHQIISHYHIASWRSYKLYSWISSSRMIIPTTSERILTEHWVHQQYWKGKVKRLTHTLVFCTYVFYSWVEFWTRLKENVARVLAAFSQGKCFILPFNSLLICGHATAVTIVYRVIWIDSSFSHSISIVTE